jgi:Family of unknown function (DUF6526)
MLMAVREQTYKKHARWRPWFHFFVIPVLLVNVLVSVWHFWQMRQLETAYGVVFAIALLGLGILSRNQALTVQDRLIRLEMRLRLRQILPPELQPRITDLTPRQLVALRFASDEELADLVRDVFAGKITASSDIKRRVRNWQADWLRA